MRTTIRLDDDLLAEVKQLAARTGRTMTELIQDALRELVSRSKSAPKGERFRLPTFRGDGLQPGVDLDSNAALLDLMDEYDFERGDAPR